MEAIDEFAFRRAAELFSAKRQALPPHAVIALADEVVRRLALAAPSSSRDGRVERANPGIAAFCDVLIQPEAAATVRFIEARRAEGESKQDVYLRYIAGAARMLGEQWDRDDISLIEMTTATGHLYAVMRALKAERPSGRAAFDARKYALFATVPGEDHSIGITIAADMFRDAGWEIDLQVGRDHDSLLARVEQARPHIVGLTLSTEQRLDSLVRLVVAIRLIEPDALIGVAPAASVKRETIVNLVDIDLVFQDARDACVELDRLIRFRR